MNPLLTTDTEEFKAGKDNLEYFRNRHVKLKNGALLYCVKGEADISIDLQKHHVVPQTTIVLLPNSIFSLSSADEDFQVYFFSYSAEMMRAATFRLEPAFMHFLKVSSCYIHPNPNAIRSILGILEASTFTYEDKENRFKNNIAQNFLQIFFWDTYDKVQRFFTKEQVEGNDRKEQLFKKFISLVHKHSIHQRDVGFYANELCISTRYLSAITQHVSSMSAKEIIDRFLILEIRVTLESTNLSLKEIAERYRFPDQSFFGRYFKKHTGMSPKEYRAKTL